MVKEITLKDGRIALVDDEDYERLSQFVWYSAGGTPQSGRYAARHFRGQGLVYMHREIVKPAAGKVVDHINGNILDNRRSNLRAVSFVENVLNRQGANRTSQTGVRGVWWRPHAKKYQVAVSVDCKQRHLGYFETLEEAETAAIEGRRRLAPSEREPLEVA